MYLIVKLSYIMPGVYLFLGANYLADRYLRFKKIRVNPIAIKLVIGLVAVLPVILAWKLIRLA
jgi:hypothetical protein